MHGARSPLEAHIERPSRRRDAIALGGSLVLHALALLLLLIQTGSAGGAPGEPDVTADVIVEESARSAAPPPTPVPTQPPLPTQAPVPPPVPPRPVPRRHIVLPTPPPPRHRELARNRPSAPPQPTAPPSRPPTIPPTVPPTSVPTVEPSAVVAVVTEAPTAPPTLRSADHGAYGAAHGGSDRGAHDRADRAPDRRSDGRADHRADRAAQHRGDLRANCAPDVRRHDGARHRRGHVRAERRTRDAAPGCDRRGRGLTAARRDHRPARARDRRAPRRGVVRTRGGRDRRACGARAGRTENERRAGDEAGSRGERRPRFAAGENRTGFLERSGAGAERVAVLGERLAQRPSPRAAAAWAGRAGPLHARPGPQRRRLGLRGRAGAAGRGARGDVRPDPRHPHDVHGRLRRVRVRAQEGPVRARGVPRVPRDRPPEAAAADACPEPHRRIQPALHPRPPAGSEAGRRVRRRLVQRPPDGALPTGHPHDAGPAPPVRPAAAGRPRAARLRETGRCRMMADGRRRWERGQSPRFFVERGEGGRGWSRTARRRSSPMLSSRLSMRFLISPSSVTSRLSAPAFSGTGKRALCTSPSTARAVSTSRRASVSPRGSMPRSTRSPIPTRSRSSPRG